MKMELFIIDGYKYSLPSIGAENCLTSFLIHKTNQPTNQQKQQAEQNHFQSNQLQKTN